ncbi:hypothetical protein VCHC65A1_02710B, partial [Vibrio cholerae HC-65A1]
NKTQL